MPQRPSFILQLKPVNKLKNYFKDNFCFHSPAATNLSAQVERQGVGDKESSVASGILIKDENLKCLSCMKTEMSMDMGELQQPTVTLAKLVKLAQLVKK